MRSVFTGNPAAGADDCCALAASGQDTEVTEDRAAAPPMMAMNARRDASKEPRRRVIEDPPAPRNDPEPPEAYHRACGRAHHQGRHRAGVRSFLTALPAGVKPHPEELTAEPSQRFASLEPGH
jgi:hypothetical protein